MPQVPVYGAPIQASDPLPNVRREFINDNAARILQGGLQNFSAGLEKAGATALEIARLQRERDASVAEMVNRAATIDQKNQFGTFTGTLLRGDPNKPGDIGFLGMQGADALNSRQTADKAVDDEMQARLGQAATPQQRQLLEQALGEQARAAHSAIGEHYGTQVPKYVVDTAKASQTLAENEAASNFGDPEKQGKAFESLDQAIASQGHAQGWDAGGTQYAAARLMAHSKVHRSVMDGLVSTDPHAASRYYEEHRLDMTLDDQAAIGPKVVLSDKSESIQQMQRQFRGGGGGPGTTAAPAGVYAAVEGAETDKRLPLDKQVSSAGAKGVMQLMTGTARAAARRIAATGDADMARVAALPDAQLDQQLLTNHDLNRRLGREELNYRQGQRGGSLVMALTDYNAGPGRTDQWIKAYGDPRTGQISYADWIKKIPFADTRAYVTKILGQAGGSSAAVTTPADGHSLEETLAYGREKFKDDPVGRDMWEKEALAFDGQLSKIKTDRQEQSFADAQPLFQNPPASRTELFKDPRYWKLDTSRQNQLANMVDEQGKKLAKQAEDQQRVEAARLGGAYLDPHNSDDVKALNSDFNARASTWGKLNPADRNARAVAYTQQLGVLPDAVRGWVEGGLRSPDPSQRLAAATLYAQVSAASPGAAQGFHQEDVGSAQFLLHMISSGMTPQQAVELQNDRAKTTPQDLQSRDQAFTASAAAAKKSGKLDPESFLKTKLGQDAVLNQQVRGMFGMTGAGKSVEVPPSMVGEMNTVARELYRQSGDYQSSMAGAYDVVRRVWAPSVMSGQRSFVKNAPETIYGIPGKTVEQNAKWMREQAASELPHPTAPVAKSAPVMANNMGVVSFSAAPGSRQEPAKVGTGEDLVFVEAAGRRGKGGLPVYWVMRKDDYGLHNVKTSGGQAAMFQPDYGSSPAAKRARDRQVEKERELRKKRGTNRADELQDAAALAIRTGG